MTSQVLTVVLTVMGGTLGGGIAGGALALWYAKPRSKQQAGTHQDHDSVDVLEDAYITDAADRWAMAHGQPAAGPLVANKLRLGLRLAERRSRRWWR